MAMKPEETATALWTAMEARDWDAARALLADDFHADWPQTREHIESADDFIALNRNYPGEWHLSVGHVVSGGTQTVTLVRIENGDEVFFATSFFEIEGGLIRSAVEIFGESGEPPYDRSQWARRY